MTDAEVDQLLASYRPNEIARHMVRDASIVLLVGITGAGKNTLKHELLKDKVYFDYISHTTRPPRSNAGVMERDGVNYHFIDIATAIDMIKRGEFIEAKRVHSNIYGTAVEGLRPSVEAGRVAVNDVDVQGVEEYKAISSGVHAVFILPPSFDEWNRRRLARYEGVIDAADNRIRLQSAMSELDFALASGLFDFIVNDDVSHAAECVKQIVEHGQAAMDRKKAIAVARQLRDDLWHSLTESAK